jgi:hypothetical protein
VGLENRQAWSLGCAIDLGSGASLPSGEYCLFFLDSSHDGLLLCGFLALLSSDDLVAVSDTLSEIWLWFLESADLGSKLANSLAI